MKLAKTLPRLNKMLWLAYKLLILNDSSSQAHCRNIFLPSRRDSKVYFVFPSVFILNSDNYTQMWDIQEQATVIPAYCSIIHLAVMVGNFLSLGIYLERVWEPSQD